MQTNLIGVQYDIQNATINEQIGIIKNQVEIGKRNIYILENQGEITKEEANASREKWSLQLAGMAIENSFI